MFSVPEISQGQVEQQTLAENLLTSTDYADVTFRQSSKQLHIVGLQYEFHANPCTNTDKTEPIRIDV